VLRVANDLRGAPLTERLQTTLSPLFAHPRFRHARMSPPDETDLRRLLAEAELQCVDLLQRDE
jgi:hypothetical protein